MSIKCVIFDLGNVIVRWDPLSILREVFPSQDVKTLYMKMRSGWIDWNLGKLTQQGLTDQYKAQLGLSDEQLNAMFNMVMESQKMIPGSYELLEDLHKKGIPLFSITDNTLEIMEYHRNHSKFLDFFTDIVVSAEEGVLKPNPEIYLKLLNRNNLDPSTCVFFDDLEVNVKGADDVGIYGKLFTGIEDARYELIKLGVIEQDHNDL